MGPVLPLLSFPNTSHKDQTCLHEECVVDLFHTKPGQKILDVGCRMGYTMRAIAEKSESNIVGITINEYQVGRARAHNKKAGLDSTCEVVCGNFLPMQFDDSTFDGAYSIETTCHAPKLEDVYAEVFRVLKPGALYVSYEWMTAELYNPKNEEHVECIQGIERGDASPELRAYNEFTDIAKKVGFEVLEEDLAKAPAGPWWTRLKMWKIAYWRNHLLVNVMTFLRITLKGVLEVHEMLYETAKHLSKGGDTGIFSPMHIILCRKPDE